MRVTRGSWRAEELFADVESNISFISKCCACLRSLLILSASLQPCVWLGAVDVRKNFSQTSNQISVSFQNAVRTATTTIRMVQLVADYSTFRRLCVCVCVVVHCVNYPATQPHRFWSPIFEPSSETTGRWAVLRSPRPGYNTPPPPPNPNHQGLKFIFGF